MILRAQPSDTAAAWHLPQHSSPTVQHRAPRASCRARRTNGERWSRPGRRVYRAEDTCARRPTKCSVARAANPTIDIMHGQPGAEYWVGSGDPQPLKNYVERMYAMYPSNQPMQFGAMPFNDVRLSYSDFSITRLQQDTGYAPAHSFEETVQQLYNHLISLQ